MCLAGKAPPNLAQGIPPLLANQYIMGPGGLLPAYPVSTVQFFFFFQNLFPALLIRPYVMDTSCLSDEQLWCGII